MNQRKKSCLPPLLVSKNSRHVFFVIIVYFYVFLFAAQTGELIAFDSGALNE